MSAYKNNVHRQIEHKISFPCTTALLKEMGKYALYEYALGEGNL